MELRNSFSSFDNHLYHKKMKKLLIIALFTLTSLSASAQTIKLFDSYLRAGDAETRYVVVLTDNTIWWFAPGFEWEKSSKAGLPDKSIKLISCYSHKDGSTRYVVVLSDDSIWWYAPGSDWTKSSSSGLPSGHEIIHFEAYSKADGTRYTAVLKDGSVWWFAPGNPWAKSSMSGLPE